MKRPKLWLGGPPEGGEPQLSLNERRRSILWPLPTHTVVRFPQEANSFVDVELSPVEETVRVKQDDDEDAVQLRERWVVTGIAVRRGYKTKAQPHADWSSPVVWDDALSLEDSVSTREVRRMPLYSRVQQAIAIVLARTPEQIIGAAATAPPGRPTTHGTHFYRELAASYRAFELEGKRPVQEIARRKRVSPNLVHQWVFKARELGLLQESSFSGKKRRGGS